MPEVSRSTAKPAPVAEIEINRPAPLKIALRTKPRAPIYDINRHRFMVTGEPGVGKTTLGAVEEGVYNLSFDPLRETYEIVQDYVPDWRHFLGYLQLLEKLAAKDGPFPYKRIQIDGTEIWYRHCFKHVCTGLGVKHVKHADYGEGWDALKDELGVATDRLMALPCGIWFTCHGKDKEVSKWDGTKITRLSPELTKTADEIVCGRCDVIMNIQYIGEDNRIATIRGNDSITAKCDINGRFLTPDGRPVKEIVLGSKGPQVAWEKLLRAYENKQGWADYTEMLNLLAKQKKGKEVKAKEPEETETA